MGEQIGYRLGAVLLFLPSLTVTIKRALYDKSGFGLDFLPSVPMDTRVGELEESVNAQNIQSNIMFYVDENDFLVRARINSRRR